MAKEHSLRITEYDEADNVTSTYVQSDGQQVSLDKRISRVDVIPPLNPKTLWKNAVEIFLPVGFPHSVTSDYLEYQIYDSLQAFSSSIASLLSSRAVLSSVGVGDATASPTAAIILSILQESAGRIATILFAHRFGTSLEPECKMYRLLADVLNDTAFIIDCMSPVFSKPIRVVLLSFSSVLRSLCGVAAGSSKASLSAHFAKQGNLGELNAKDSSQETVISLIGMLVGSFVITWITTPLQTWTALFLLLSIHLETNRRAVRAVKMLSLNRQRATLVYHYLSKERVPTPEEIAQKERIFERDGVLRNSNDTIIGRCAVGTSMSRLFKAIGDTNQQTRSSQLADKQLAEIVKLYAGSGYLLWCDRTSTKRRPSLFIVVKKGARSKDIIVAWWQALAVASELSAGVAFQGGYDFDVLLELFGRSLRAAKEMMDRFEDHMKKAGWDLELAALETMTGVRVNIEGA